MACNCGSQDTVSSGPMVSCAACRTWHHVVCCGVDETAIGQWCCPRCQAQAVAMSTPAPSIGRAYAQSDERFSAFKGEHTSIALAPSPMFGLKRNFAQAAAEAQTPLNRAHGSPSSRPHQSKILSYGTDMWNAYIEEPSSAAPSTPGPTRTGRFSTPGIEDAPFDVTSTSFRHLDFNFG